MSTPPLRRRLVAVATAVLAPAALLVGLTGPPASAATAITVPSDALDGACVAMEVFSGSTSQGYVVRSGNGYAFTSSASGATPFRFEASQLSRYELFDSSGARAYLSVLNWAMPGSTYGDRSDWTVTASGSRYAITSTLTGQRLGSYLWSLGAGSSGSTVALTSSTGCFTPPDVETGVRGAARPAVDANGKLVGAIDLHMHVTAGASFGGQLHCGEAWSSGGVATALAGCGTHGSLNIGALLEGVLGGTDIADSPEDGWPTFGDWPQRNSQLHEQAYFRNIERAYRSGVRVIDALLVGNRVICEIFPYKDSSCDEMDQVRLQAAYLASMQDYIDAQSGGAGKGWFRIARTPAQVREIVSAGKLAVLVGVEISEPFGCRSVGDVPQCTRAQIDAGLDELAALGVSGLFPVHKFDNAFGGVRMDGGVAGAAVNIGNLIATGHWWQVDSCTGAADLAQPITSDEFAKALSLGVLKLPAGAILPVYPTGKICNIRGLTSLGEYLVRQMMARGMIIHVDHMGVRTAQATLDIVQAAKYPGVVSDHTWSDPKIVDRILAAGGFVAGFTFSTDTAVVGKPTFVEEWRSTRALPNGAVITGYGFGSDVNGLADLPAPPVSTTTDPFSYPFTSLAGTTVDRQVMGSRTFDYNTDGVAHYGLYAEFLVDAVHRAGSDGPQLEKQLLNGAEVYTAMWERAIAW